MNELPYTDLEQADVPDEADWDDFRVFLEVVQFDLRLEVKLSSF